MPDVLHDEIYDELVGELEAVHPRFRVQYKNKTWHQKLLGFLMFWMWRWEDGEWYSEYMTRYTSVLGFTVYYPSDEFVRLRAATIWATLAHEGQHLSDRKKWPVLFNLGYALPQLLALLSVGVFWGQWWALGWLIWLLPVPSYFRMVAELRGYTITLYTTYWRMGSIPDSKRTLIMDQFTASAYWYMWPFKRSVKKRVDVVIERILDGQPPKTSWGRSVARVASKHYPRACYEYDNK